MSFVKPPVTGDVLKNVYDLNYNTEVGIVAEGTVAPIGAVVGMVTASSKLTLSPHTEVVGREGAEVAYGVLLQAVDATAGDVSGVVVLRRGPAIVARGALTFDATVDDGSKEAAKVAQLTSLGIVARQTI